jgi:hypothetical protein
MFFSCFVAVELVKSPIKVVLIVTESVDKHPSHW